LAVPASKPVFFCVDALTHSMLQLINDLSALIHRLSRRLVPVTLISFLIVGSLGVIVHMAVLKLSMHFITGNFRVSNAVAMLCAATFNYTLNNKSTFRHDGLAGKRVFAGYLIYLGITSLGLGASLLVSGAVYDRTSAPMMAALCGIIVGSLWNYFMSYNFVWKLLSGRLGRAKDAQA
jgi:dolichol-phosphate mannosyltransferase